MKCAILLKLCVLSLFGWGIWYSRFHTFRETHVSVDIEKNESKEICINNSSAVFDLWNNRLLHISSSSPSYELYSKKTIFVPFLNNKKVAGLMESGTDGRTFSANVRMYFSQCYVIENRSEGTLHIDAWTYRSFCYVNVCLMGILVVATLYDWKMVLNEALFFAISVIAVFVQCTSFITYIPVFFEHLPGMHVILEGLLYSSVYTIFGGIFITAIFSLLLRLGLNYYHFSLHDLHRVPRIVSAIGPLLCKYQYWVVGVYLALAMSIIPFNSDMIPVIGISGCLLVGILLYYGRTLAIDNLSNGFVVSLLLLLFVLCSWVFGFMKIVFPSKENKEEDKKNKCTVCYASRSRMDGMFASSRWALRRRFFSMYLFSFPRLLNDSNRSFNSASRISLFFRKNGFFPLLTASRS